MKLFAMYGSKLDLYISQVHEDKIREMLLKTDKENISVIAGRTPPGYPKESFNEFDSVKSKWHKVKITMPIGGHDFPFLNLYFTSVRMDAEQISALGLEPIKAQEQKEIRFKMTMKLKESVNGQRN